MSAHRIVWKLPAIFVTCAGSALLLALVRGFGLLLREGHDARENRVVRAWASGMARVLGMRVKATGEMPSGSFLLVSNHLSYIDVFAFMSQVDARLLSKAEVKSWPLLGPLARFGGTLFVDRTQRRDLQRVIGEIEGTLQSGRGVVFFPEGTSSAGTEVRKFKPSLFEVAVQGKFEVSTATIRYECKPNERPAQWSISWWGDMPFFPHLLGVLRLSRFEAQLHFNSDRLRGDDRKQLAANAQAAVEAAFIPVCTELGSDALFPHLGQEA